MDVSGRGKVDLTIDEDKIGWITISNSDGNTIDIEVLQDFLSALTDVMGDETVRLVALAGKGRRAFSVGYNGSCVRINDRGFLKNIYSLGFSTSKALQTLNLPVISVVDGLALGMGLEFALSTDMVIASHHSRFGMPDLKFGLPSFTGIIPEIMDRLPSQAYSRLISGEIMNAVEAKSLGIVSSVLPDDSFLKDSRKFLKDINPELFTFYKSMRSTSNKSSTVDRLFFDLYDTSKIKLKELYSFRNSL
ncbi:enoyl-CoA hydratase/isomerase family protein [Oxyplasma meridianum]|uniref:Enoyl-CoA hydratase/isomerase family protein n=1 Tax=Oxyplasma meridianum TaxID=3073602 RepID=A0AAX4NGF1_9ARCH